MKCVLICVARLPHLTRVRRCEARPLSHVLVWSAPKEFLCYWLRPKMLSVPQHACKTKGPSERFCIAGRNGLANVFVSLGWAEPVSQQLVRATSIIVCGWGVICSPALVTPAHFHT